jgi:hypothetical protein
MRAAGIVTLLLLSLGTSYIRAQWIDDGNPVCTAGDNQLDPEMVSDGMGGAILTWRDYRSGGWNIHAQRIDADGSIHAGWPADGVAICKARGDQWYPQIASDNAGGALIAWRDERGGTFDIYAQRIDGDGGIHSGWAVNGNPVCIEFYEQYDPQITSDGAGGAYITWPDDRNGSFDIYIQRIDGDGLFHAGWPIMGVAACTAAGGQYVPQIVSDGTGGAIITWQDARTGGSDDIYVQRIDGDGGIHAGWPADGIAVCAAGRIQWGPHLVSDGASGAMITWHDYRSGGNADVYAQRVDGDGGIHAGWPTDGAAVCTATDWQGSPRIVLDGAGGAMITWSDYRGGNGDIYAQQIDGDGSVHAGWPVDGVAICSAAGDQYGPQIVTDGAGGAIITWPDRRSGSLDIYAQRLDGDGGVHIGWQVDGEAVCTAAEEQGDPRLISDGAGGAIVTWHDSRSGSADIYALKLDQYGNAPPTAVGDITPGASLLQNYPNPFNPTTAITYYLPERNRVLLEIFDVSGRLISRLVDTVQDRGLYAINWDGLDREGEKVSSGIYFYRLTAGTEVHSRKMVFLK